MYDVFSLYLQRGNVDVGFLGGAQIDRFGNINATVIGDYDHPKVRLPGSVGPWRLQPGQTAATS
jgi:glutaconate CoA-transferase subunit B